MSKTYNERINDLNNGIKLLKFLIDEKVNNDEPVPMSWLDAVDDIGTEIVILEELKSNEKNVDHNCKYINGLKLIY